MTYDRLPSQSSPVHSKRSNINIISIIFEHCVITVIVSNMRSVETRDEVNHESDDEQTQATGEVVRRRRDMSVRTSPPLASPPAGVLSAGAASQDQILCKNE